VAEAFSKYFQSVYSSPWPETYPLISPLEAVISCAPISDSEAHTIRTMKRCGFLDQAELMVCILFYKELL
jgi:hypothetical protein